MAQTALTERQAHIHKVVSAISHDVLEMMIESAKDSGEINFLAQFCMTWLGNDFEEHLAENGIKLSELK